MGDDTNRQVRMGTEGGSAATAAWDVLVVDGDSRSGQFLEMMLSDMGCRTHIAATRQEALSYCHDSQADMVVVAEHLPDGCGLEVANCFASAEAEIVLVTDELTTSSAVAAMQLRIADCMVKPFNAQDLVARLSRVLELVRIKSENRHLIDVLRAKTTRAEEMAQFEKQQSRMLREANEALLLREKALATTRVGVTIKDVSNKIIYANPAELAMHGYEDLDDVVGKDASVFGSQEKRQARTPQDIESRGGWRRESFNIRKDGSRFPVYLVSDVVRNDVGKMIAVVTICEDITERQGAKDEIRRLQEERLEIQRKLIASLSTPLIPIASDALLMPLVGPLDTQRAQQVLDRLLDGIQNYHARRVLLDLTGVDLIDSRVAETILMATDTCRLLGAQVVLSGISPATAQSMVKLGVDVSKLQIVGSIQAGIALARRDR